MIRDDAASSLQKALQKVTGDVEVQEEVVQRADAAVNNQPSDFGDLF